MKHATILLVLAGALGACGGDDKTANAAEHSSAKQAAHDMGASVGPATTDPNVARTPVAPPLTTPVDKPSVAQDRDIDTRLTDPVGTDAAIVDGQKPSNAGNSDALTPPGSPSSQQVTPGDTNPNGALAGQKPDAKNAKDAKEKTAALGPMDTEFIGKAAIAGLFEVQSSDLAVSQATAPFVRDFAQMMVVDHGDAIRELETLARGKNVPFPKDLDDDHKLRLNNLRDQKGVDFDREYREQQVTAHKDAISLFDRAAATCEDPELKAFAAKLLPKLREHQQKLNEMPPTQG